jgi:hypothetical protein
MRHRGSLAFPRPEKGALWPLSRHSRSCPLRICCCDCSQHFLPRFSPPAFKAACACLCVRASSLRACLRACEALCVRVSHGACVRACVRACVAYDLALYSLFRALLSLLFLDWSSYLAHCPSSHIPFKQANQTGIDAIISRNYCPFTAFTIPRYNEPLDTPFNL